MIYATVLGGGGDEYEKMGNWLSLVGLCNRMNKRGERKGVDEK